MVGQKAWSEGWCQDRERRCAKILKVRVKIDDEIIEIDQSEGSEEPEDIEDVVGQSENDHEDERESEDMEEDRSVTEPDMEDEEDHSARASSFSF